VFTSNGDSFVWHDRTGLLDEVEQTIALDSFPSQDTLYKYFKQWRGIEDEHEELVKTGYYVGSGKKSPRYYQRIAINKSI